MNDFGSITKPDEAAMRAANVNPATGLATDYLNLFNEYIMLAEMVSEGMMEIGVLRYWHPIDYEAHFAQSGFTGLEVVLAAYRSLGGEAKREFEDAVNRMIDLILVHQNRSVGAPDTIAQIKHQRDHIATLINDPVHTTDMDNSETQAGIDALFD